jgi:adenine-specific DNA-methyltransferase
MTDLNDLLVTSPDLNEERLETLKRLFPDLFTNEGKLDPVELKRLLEDEATTDKEQYTFTWRGKGKAKKHAFMPSRAALTYDPKRSVNPDRANGNGNMIIEGENLEVLKLLTSAYREQVKCIYIDPPYNTGGDYIYPDNYAKDRKEYWEENGTYQDGVKMDSNPETSGRYHSDWLSMMYSRLLVARQLLQDDGVIFVSIDGNEVNNLRKMMDEVFGEESFVEIVTWKNKYGAGAKTRGFITLHEFIICYSKTPLSNIEAPLTEEEIKEYEKRKDEKYLKRGGYVTQPLMTKSLDTRANLQYSITYEGEEIKPRKQWVWEKTRLETAIKNDGVVFKKKDDGEWSVRFKQYLKLEDGTIRKGKPLSVLNGPFTQEGTQEIREIFQGDIFPFPKPTRLIKYLYSFVFNENDDRSGIYLDFFAGSGTSGQAILELNREDGGSRKFILVQIPETTSESHAAYKAGYRTISQITIERNKRVVEGYGNNPQPLDTGFKVYRLTKSHFPRAEFQPEPDKSNEENIELLKKYIAEKEASFHMAFEQDQVFDEVLLKNGFKLDYKLTKQEEFGKDTVYLVEEGDRKAYICLDTNIAEETIDYFKTHTDTMFICLERALDTTKKWNLNHTLGERLKAI